jgi:hypothetical protein
MGLSLLGDISACRKYDFAVAHISLVRVRIVSSHWVTEADKGRQIT